MVILMIQSVDAHNQVYTSGSVLPVHQFYSLAQVARTEDILCVLSTWGPLTLCSGMLSGWPSDHSSATSVRASVYFHSSRHIALELLNSRLHRQKFSDLLQGCLAGKFAAFHLTHRSKALPLSS